MSTDLHLTVVGIRSTRDSRGEMSDGLGLSSTTSPADLYADIAVLHSPGFRGDPLTVPIEVLERQDFGASLPPTPDSLKRVSKITIKPEDASKYNERGPVYESLEDVYDDTVGNTYPVGVPLKSGKPNPPAGLGGNFGQEEPNVTVRIPLEDTEDTKVMLDDRGISWSVVGINRFELHGKMSEIEPMVQSLANDCGCGIEMEVMGPEEAEESPVSVEAPQIGQKALPLDKPFKNDEEGLEEAYNGVHGEPSVRGYTIEVANAFADNLVHYLATESISHATSVDGSKTLVKIRSKATAKDIETDIKNNVIGSMTYLRVYESE